MPMAMSQPNAAQTWRDQQLAQAWATASLQHSPREHQWVTLVLGGRTMKAFVTFPQGRPKGPAVLVLHEVFGLTDSTLATADRIAAVGHVTVAPDMLSGFAPDGGGTSAFPTSRIAGDFMTVLPDETVNANLAAWSDYAAKLPGADGKVAMVGLSWGGGAAFRYAASQGHHANLRGVFVFYDVGPPATTQGPGKAGTIAPMTVDAIDVPVYGFYPAQDVRVMKSLAQTKVAMAAARKTFDPVGYEKAEHAFMRLSADRADRNPANAEALQASLVRLAALLDGL